MPRKTDKSNFMDGTKIIRIVVIDDDGDETDYVVLSGSGDVPEAITAVVEHYQDHDLIGSIKTVEIKDNDGDNGPVFLMV
jgi:hypothetical protein